VVSHRKIITSAALCLAAGLASVGTVAAPAMANPPNPELVGWASTTQVSGGAGAPASSIYVVSNRAELVRAIANNGAPDAPKIIYVKGSIYGDEAADGRHLGQQDYRPGWDLDRYIACFGPNADEWSDTRFPDCGDLRRGRVTGSNNEKAQIQLTLGANTSLIGLGTDAALIGVYLTINNDPNVIVRNLTLESPIDYFPSWDPGDDGGSWNARFDAMSVVTGTGVWVDHCTFTDGAHPDSAAPAGPHGKYVQRHDGLLDMEDGTDLVTVSNSVFENHSKTLLLGSGDTKGDRDRGKLRVTFVGNHFIDTEQRSPRVRFGQVHVVNNLYSAATNDPERPIATPALGGEGYFLGMGVESQIYSEYNAFDYTGPGADPSVIVGAYGGTEIEDHGSWFNSRKVDVAEVAASQFAIARDAALASAAAAGTAPPAWTQESFQAGVEWDPNEEYAYHPMKSEPQVTRSVLANAGAGKLRPLPIAPN
jgi:pectate lyase